MPSHQTSPSGVTATLVKIASCSTVFMALGLDFVLVPGATPKKPASGLTAHSRPSAPTRSHAISSPMVCTRHPLKGAGGNNIARLVLPQALGNAAAM